MGLLHSKRLLSQGVRTTRRRVVLGFGVCHAEGLSAGLPWDALAPLLISESIAQHAPLLVVADAHAAAKWGPAAYALGRAYEQALNTIACNADLRLEILPATKLHLRAEHHQWSRRVAGHALGPYTRMQSADVLSLIERYGPIMKVGWAYSRAKSRGRDERFFDQRLRDIIRDCEVNEEDFSGVYLRAPRSLHDRRHAPPYIAHSPGERLLVGDSPDQMRRKLWGCKTRDPQAYRDVLGYYRAIFRLRPDLMVAKKGVGSFEHVLVNSLHRLGTGMRLSTLQTLEEARRAA